MYTLAGLAAAVKNGLKGTMMIDNDYVCFIAPSGALDEDGENVMETVYEAHLAELAEQALDFLGIPHESV